MNKQNIKNFTYEELFNFHGYEVDYIIRNSKGKGKLSVDKVQNKIYICQNEQAGIVAPDKLNFKYSYELNTISVSNSYWKKCIENIYLPEKSMTTNEILEHAKKNYPIGTVFKCLNDQQICTVADDYKDPNKNQWLNNQTFIIRKKEGSLFGAYLYKDGKWAEIVSKPEENVENINEFKKGDYIVTLKGDFRFTACAKENYCFKIRRNSTYVSIEKTLNGISDANHTLKFDKTDNLYDWRYATPEEIAEYNRLGKPYDVTTLQKKEKPKSLVGRYLKALVDNPNAGTVKKGEYGKIISDYKADFPSQKNYCCAKAILMLSDSNTIYDGRYELMPEGFEPNKEEFKEEIPEYVECLINYNNQFTKGKIYKTNKKLDEYGNIYIIKDDMGDRNGLKPSNFKPSTKEAYDRQQKALGIWNGEIKEKWIPKVGDWIVSLINREPYRKKGDIFQVLKVGSNCIYYLKTTNGDINTFRKAEPHEIPKENKYITGVDPIKETEPEIDSWCIQLTEENRGLLFQNKDLFKGCWSFDSLGSYYGFNKSNNPYCSDKDSFDKVLTTEEFCKKFNIINPITTNSITNTEEKPQWLENLNDIWPQTVKKQSNRIEVKLIPVKKLIKN